MPTDTCQRPREFTAQLVDTYAAEWPRMRRLAARLVGEDRAEEVVQEAVTKLWSSPDRFDPTRGSMGGYLAVLCRGAALDRLRADAARQNRESRFAWAVDAAESGSAPDHEGLITGALAGLPDRERTPILLAVYQGLSYREIATSLGLPEGTVKSRIRAGLRRLRSSVVPLLA